MPAAPKGKALSKLPDFKRGERVPVGDIFVHGSGECDQLGLGDAQRERKKPTLIRELVGVHICDVAVGALHVICMTSAGRLYSWGCNDDGALGRPSDDTTDSEPHHVGLPEGVVVRKVTCGDNHTCALDHLERVWLWGTYKDSNGHIGAARRCKRDDVQEKSVHPTIVLEGGNHIASGANHTVALGPAGKVFAWGSNGTGQLGLRSGAGCGIDERILPVPSIGMPVDRLRPRIGGGTEVDGLHLLRVRENSGAERSVMTLPPDQVQLMLSGAAALVLEVAERDVPKPEKQELLIPQEVCLDDVDGTVTGVFASAECSFVTVTGGYTYACGLNGDGQVGVGFASFAVKKLRRVPGATGASWLAGGTHSTAALINGEVHTWGKADECGHGFGASASPLMEPRVVAGLPKVRALRCGVHHTLACTEAGDVFAWGCGISYQLANRPRDFSSLADAGEDPEDELKPYRISSKQLETRFVMLADGGAQHSVELAWAGHYEPTPSELGLAATTFPTSVASFTTGVSEAAGAGEPPAKRSRRPLAVQPTKQPQADFKLAVEVKAEVLKFFSGHLLSEELAELQASQAIHPQARQTVLWSPRSEPWSNAALAGQTRDVAAADPALRDELACLRRVCLEDLLVAVAGRDEVVRQAVRQAGALGAASASAPVTAALSQDAAL